MIEWDSIAATLERGERKARRKNSSPPRAPDTKKQAKTSPYLVPLWKAEKVKRKGKGGKQLSKKARKYLRKLRPPDYLRKIPFEYDRIGRPTKRVSLLKDETARNHYNVYTSEYNFAFNSSCVFEVGIPGRQFKFYGIAFDFYQMKHHLLHDLLPNGDAPCKIQNMFRDVGHDLDRLVIQELQVCTPFIVKQHRGKVPMPFDQYVVALKHRRNGWALRHVLWLVRDIRILEMWMGRWKAQHTLAQEAYMRRLNAAALKIQLAWRKKNGQMVLHMKRRIKAEHEEMERAAIMIQNAWRRRDAKKMVSNMKKRMMEEEAEMEAAALTIQLAWRRKKGQLVLHMKRRIKAEEEENRRRVASEAAKQGEFEEQTRAAIMIQNAWRRRDAKKMVANMKKRMMDEEEELNRAALKIQCAWRRRQGTLALHMKRQAKQSVYDAEAWVVLYDKDQNGAYFYDYSTHSSLWKLPEKLVKTGLHTDEWIVCEDQTRRLTYYFRTTDGSCHPIDEHSAHYQQNKWYNYSNPPPMAKIALKSEHFPKQGMVTTDIELARAEMSGIGGYYNEQYQGSFEQNYSNNYEHGPSYY